MAPKEGEEKRFAGFTNLRRMLGRKKRRRKGGGAHSVAPLKSTEKERREEKREERGGGGAHRVAPLESTTSADWTAAVQPGRRQGG